MSDPAKSSEIEDVLASIRKLVSVDPTGGLKAPRGALTQKLVLTSDQRVGDGDSRPDHGSRGSIAPLRLEAAPSPEDAGLSHERNEAPKNEPASGALHIVTEDREPKPDGSATGIAANSDADPGMSEGDGQNSGPTGEAGHDDPAEKPFDVDETLPTLADERFEFQLPETALREPDEADQAEDQHQPAPTLEARIAELEAAVSSQRLDFEPDGSEDLEQHRPERVPSRRPAPSADTEDAIAQLVSDAARSMVTQELGQADAPLTPDLSKNLADQRPKNRIFNRAPSALDDSSQQGAIDGSADVADEVDGNEADGPHDKEPFGTETRPRDLASVTADAEDTGPDADAAQSDRKRSVQRSNAVVYPETQNSHSNPDWDMPEEGAILDEAALRDMVSEIVRSELQGALGERITRNVRKLVRREIMRAITVRDLD